MTDPRLAEPQRVVSEPPADAACGQHRYWCWKRITGTAILCGAVTAAVWRCLR